MLPRPLPRAKLIWVTVIAVPSVLDYWADRGEPDNDTMSECIRGWFHTDTIPGRLAFTVALAGGASWLHSHILK